MELGVLSSSSDVVHSMRSELVSKWTYPILESFDPRARCSEGPVSESVSDFDCDSDFEFPFGFLSFDGVTEVYRGRRKYGWR